MRNQRVTHNWRRWAGAIICAAAIAYGNPVLAQGTAPPGGVTFTKDIVPIFQAKCQACHRPGSVAPMSLLTYPETRPWVRAIKQRVVRREMPPWHIDPTVGIQKFKNDRSLSQEQIDTIVRWIDAGAPMGDLKDMPPAVEWPNDELWTISDGEPELVLTTPPQMVAARGPDKWLKVVVDTGLTEDRYIKAIETKPAGPGSRRVVHHASTLLLNEQGEQLEMLSEFAVGKYGDMHPEGAGRKIPAGSKIAFDLHVHSVGEEINAQVKVGYVLYPKGYQPKRIVTNVNVGTINGHLYDDLDIPANTVTRHDAYLTLPKAARIISYQPHMHMRGKAMTLEAIYPNGKVETISAVDRFDFNWHVAYVYDDDVAPLLPAGTKLHTIGIHDNTAAHRGNPDPNQWVGFGNRTFDDMLQCHVLLYYMTDEEFAQEVADRRAKQKVLSTQNQQQ